MKRSLLLLGITILALLLLSPCGAYAAKKPTIVSHDEMYVSRTVRFRVAWQSENPVVMVKIFTGREQKEIKVDEYDNRRTRDGYSGEVNAVVELDPAFADESLAFTIQLEDDARLKSDLMQGKIQIAKVKKDDDQWGQSAITSQPSMQQPGGPQQTTGSTGVEILDRVIGVMDRYDMPPVLGNIKINRVGTDGVTVGMRASDDKALASVTFKIVDATGNLVQQDAVTASGKSWEGTSKTFNLINGNYKAVVQATDGAGNSSREKTEFFAITGSTLTVQPTDTYSPTMAVPPVVPQPTVPDPSTTQTPVVPQPTVPDPSMTQTLPVQIPPSQPPTK